jgi:hypothetical protein
MNENPTTTYAYFNTIDYKNQNVLSSYALSGTPLLFVPEIPIGSNNRVVWSFGDGTISKSLCASKYYTFPGTYNVNLIVYDCYNNAQISSFTQSIKIIDYFPLSFSLSASDYNNLEIKNGKIHGPFEFTATYPPYQSPISIQFSISGSNSLNYFDISSNKYSHLENYNSFFDKVYNHHLSANQYLEIPQIDLNLTKIYGKIVNNSIKISTIQTSNSFYVGISGGKSVYFKDDLISPKVLIDFYFDRNNITVFDKISNYVNTLGIRLSSKIIDNDDVDHLSITSNGLDGEQIPVESFNISPIKYFNTKIPFIIKIKDSENHSVKNFPKLDINSTNIVVLSSDTRLDNEFYSISSLNYTLSSQEHGGSMRGYVTFNSRTDVLSNIMLSSNITIINDSLSTYTLSGKSSAFNVYPLQSYSIYKKNENFNSLDILKNLRFQEFLLDKNITFDEFFGSILGNENSNYNAIGTKTYEKISNFIDNISNVDRNEINSLISQLKMLGNKSNIYDSSLFSSPEEIKRILNLGSIDKNKLFGETNKFDQNFETKGYSSKDYYGRNIGNRIDNSTYTISAGIPIVALEKFSGKYTKLNTSQPISAVSSTYYKLSSYSDSWGWPLVLPQSFIYTDFDKYYTFFEYVSGYDSTLTDFTIDFGNPKTTLLSSSSWDDFFGDNKIYDNIMMSNLYMALSTVDA